MNRTILALFFAMLPTLAFAHVGVGDTSGFSHGLMHPLSGIDHILAMVAVGMLAAQMGGRALWLVPLAFVGMMVVGGTLGVAGVPVPFVEAGIGLSVVVLGGALALGLTPPLALAMATVGVFAVFHGHAHGAEMPDTASGLGYGLGFVLATALLHVAGIGVGLSLGQARGQRLARLAGGGMALAGVAILGGAI